MNTKYVSAEKALAYPERLAAWKSGAPAAPVTVEWDLSNRCPLGCGFCHFAHTHVRGPWASRERRLPVAYEGTGDLADLVVVRRGLASMAAFGVLGVVWSGGGEPTTHPEWREAVAHANRLGLRQGMYTAGVLLDEAGAELLARTASWVVVSLDAADADGYAREKGSAMFERACQAVRLLAAAGATVSASFVLHAGNAGDLLRMLGLARALKATYATFRPAILVDASRPAQPSEERAWIEAALPQLRALGQEPDVECDADRFEAYLRWTGRSYRACHGIKLNATVTPDGRVWVCPQRRGVLGSQVGDLREAPFGELWQRHVGTWTDFRNCRAMCRLHKVNEALAPVFAEHWHREFV